MNKSNVVSIHHQADKMIHEFIGKVQAEEADIAEILAIVVYKNSEDQFTVIANNAYEAIGRLETFKQMVMQGMTEE